MTAWELLVALPAVRTIALLCLTLGTLCGAGAVLAFTWRWPAHGPEAVRLRRQRDDAWAQVRELLEQNKRMARLVVDEAEYTRLKAVYESATPGHLHRIKAKAGRP